MAFVLKLKFEEEIRRILLQDPQPTHEAVMAEIQAAWPARPAEQMVAMYRDEEGDSCVLHPMSFSDFLSLAHSSGTSQILRLELAMRPEETLPEPSAPPMDKEMQGSTEDLREDVQVPANPVASDSAVDMVDGHRFVSSHPPWAPEAICGSQWGTWQDGMPPAAWPAWDADGGLPWKQQMKAWKELQKAQKKWHCEEWKHHAREWKCHVRAWKEQVKPTTERGEWKQQCQAMRMAWKEDKKAWRQQHHAQKVAWKEQQKALKEAWKAGAAW
eukprot:gb/GFBE01057154.1/.p1 GENE.gb/GFBE01057154.1/~~gb/GFBE01057154.1/.p1  ORF type:complete len:271 (+),score=91.69 gb/GFBE01057154.1/:1-813(+)